MNTRIHTLFSTALFTLALTACGGGGGGGGESSGNTGDAVSAPPASSPAQDFSPDASRQLSTAGDSTELYVEEDFRFDALREIDLNISLPADYTRTAIRVYDGSALDDDWNDEDLGAVSLIMQGFTNNSAELQRQLELAGTVTHLLIEANATGFENKQRVAISDSVTVTFTIAASD